MVNTLLQNGKNLFFRREKSILSAAMIIMIAYGASGGLGLLRNRLLAQRFFSGQEQALDAYFAAFVLPDTIFQLLIVGALSAAFIPIFTEYLHRDKEEAWHVVSASMTNILMIFLLLSIPLFIFAPTVSRILTPSFSGAQVRLTANLIRIMLGAQLFFAVSSFMTGILQSHHRFLLPAIAPIFYNVGIIAGIIFLSPIIGIYGPAIGVVFGSLLHAAVQLPLVSRLGFRFRFSYDPKHPGVQRIKKLMPARAATLAVDQLERIVAVNLTSALASGTFALFNFARQLYVLPITLFGATIGQAAFPAISHARAEGEEEFVEAVSSTLLQVLFFTLPVAALLLVLRVPIVRIAFGARNFPWDATLLTGKAVALFSLSIPFQSANQLLVRAFYAAQNTRKPLIAAASASAVLLITAPLLSLGLQLGLLGIVAAIALSDMCESILLLTALHRLQNGRLLGLVLPAGIKMCIATILTGISLWIPMRLLDQYVFDTTHTLPLIGLTISASCSGLLVYLALSRIFRLPQYQLVMGLFRRLGNWKQVLESTEETLEPTQ